MKLLAVGVAAAFAATGAMAQNQQDKPQSSGPSQSSKKQSGSSGATAAANAPLIVLVPVQVASRDSFSNGCWARLYDSTNFEGNQLSLVGPVDMPNMRTAFGTDWSGEFDSIAVGPKARLTVYDNENYEQRAATFKPGQKVADLDEKLGFFEDISSVKVACTGGSPTAQSGQGGSSASSGGSASSGSTFQRLDTDNDGSLSRSEYSKYRK
ncbi:MAG TPA: beta/gamma crystallin domain-containing protein [Burkholderiales bacterium]